MTKIKLVEVKKCTKEHYGMYAEDWWVVGIDENGVQHEGWQGEFELPPKEAKEQPDLQNWPHAQYLGQIAKLEEKVKWWEETCNWWRASCQEAWAVRNCQSDYIRYLEDELLKERGEI